MRCPVGIFKSPVLQKSLAVLWKVNQNGMEISLYIFCLKVTLKLLPTPPELNAWKIDGIITFWCPTTVFNPSTVQKCAVLLGVLGSSPHTTCFTGRGEHGGGLLLSSSGEGMSFSWLVLTAGLLSSSAPCQLYLPHSAQATQVAPVNSDKKGSSVPFYEHSPLNLSGSKIRQELLSPDILPSEGRALCGLPSQTGHVPMAGDAASPGICLRWQQAWARCNVRVTTVFRSLNGCTSLSILTRLNLLLNVFLSRKVIILVETADLSWLVSFSWRAVVFPQFMFTCSSFAFKGTCFYSIIWNRIQMLRQLGTYPVTSVSCPNTLPE